VECWQASAAAVGSVQFDFHRLAIHGTIPVAMKIVPAELTMKELKKEAQECDQMARIEAEPRASTLREKAALLREWITILKTGKWTS